MARYPNAIWKPIGRHNRGSKISKHNRLNLHVAVSEAASLYGYFSGVGDCSHFYVRKDGTVEQYMDTAYYSKSDYQGNDATISVETQGGVHNANAEPWTDAQIRSLAALWAWARDTHGIPNKLATTSRYDESSRGLSYHRLGVPARTGNKTSQTGGMLWSRAGGKICPGQGKIDQIPGIFALANGGNIPAPSPAPAPSPTKPVWKGSMGWSVLTSGQINNEVAALQRYLNTFGYGLATDGSFGPATQKAVQDWQRKHGLTGDGAVGPATQAKMAATSPSPPAPAPKPSVPQIAVDGQWGAGTTRRLQQYFGTTQDGVISGQVRGSWNKNVHSAQWGKGGSQVIAAIQRALGITADGNLGPQTIRRMQQHFGTTQDGVISSPSEMVKAMQRRLNQGQF